MAAAVGVVPSQTEAFRLGGGIVAWIKDQIAFGPKSYLANGSATPGGGAHFFYGNHFQLAAGRYLVTVHIAKPREISSRRVIVEALKWNKGESEILAKSEFKLASTTMAVLVPLAIEHDFTGYVEIRGWSDEAAVQLELQSVSVQQLNLEQLGTEHRGLTTAVPEGDANAAGPSVLLSGQQLLYSGAARPQSLLLSHLATDEREGAFCEIVPPEAAASLLSDRRFVLSCVLPGFFTEAAAGLVASVDDQKLAVTRAERPNLPSPRKGLAASFPSPGVAGPAADRLAPIRAARGEAKMGATGGGGIDAQAIAELEERLTEPLNAALAELNGFKRQVPRLLNAISAANAAVSIIGRSGRGAAGESPEVSREIAQIKRELQLLWTTVNANPAPGKSPGHPPDPAPAAVDGPPPADGLASARIAGAAKPERTKKNK